MQESLIGYVKAGYNLRKGWQTYTQAYNDIQKFGLEESTDENTMSGVYFGVGSYHVTMSSLPAKVLKVISVLGMRLK